MTAHTEPLTRGDSTRYIPVRAFAFSVCAERVLSKFHGHMLKRIGDGEFSADYGRDVFTSAKTFIRWLWQSHYIENMPRNLDALTIKKGNQEIPIIEDGTVKAIIKQLLGTNEAVFASDAESWDDSERHCRFAAG